MGRRKLERPGGPSLFEAEQETSTPASSTATLDLRSRLKALHNYIYANDRFKQHPRVFEEVMKLLVAKLFDERHNKPQQFRLTQPERSLDESTVGHPAADRINRLFTAAIGAAEFFGYYDSTARIDLSPRTLVHAVGLIGDLAILATDAKGAAFQALLSPLTRGEKGQFFTPDPVKRILVDILNPKPGEHVVDPACGSAGLLLDCLKDRPTVEASGIEIDDVLARVARMNTLLSAGREAGISHADGLADWEVLREVSGNRLSPNSADVVITNPPFGSKGRVDDPKVLARFPNLGGNRNRQVPDILFVERIVQLLKPGGRAGIVLPYGILANSSLDYVREYLRATCHIIATVSLPPVTFKPADNSVKAAVLVVRKWSSVKRPARYPTFRAVSLQIGYDHHGRPTYRRDLSGRYLDRDGNPLPAKACKDPAFLASNAALNEDIGHILEGWRTFRSELGGKYLW